MESDLASSQKRDSKLKIVARGTFRGFLAGLILSLIYSAIWPIVLITIDAFTSREITNGLFKDVLSVYIFLTAASAMFGVLPAILLGAFSGLAISTFMVFFASGSKSDDLMIGALLPLIVFAGLEVWNLDADSIGGLVAWVAVFGIPGLIYILAGSLLTRKYSEGLTYLSGSEGRSRIVRSIVKVLLAAVILFDIGYPVYIFIPRNIYETYRMRWSTTEDIEYKTGFSDPEENETCQPDVLLEFEQCPGYGLALCSQDLLEYLKKNDPDAVEVVIERSYKKLRWEYAIQRVNDWTGKVTIRKLQSLYSLADIVQGNGTNNDRSCKPLKLPDTGIVISK